MHTTVEAEYILVKQFLKIFLSLFTGLKDIHNRKAVSL